MEGYNFSLPGAYFVTIVAAGRKCVFGNIQNEENIPSLSGQLVGAIWQSLPIHFPITLDSWVLMPNHLHGILFINDIDGIDDIDDIDDIGRYRPIQIRKSR